MILSDEQIKQISKEIVFGVHQYIIEHQEEFELFKQRENTIVHLSDNSNIDMKGEHRQ